MKRISTLIASIALLMCALFGAEANAGELYTIKGGDTLSAIALRYRTTVESLARMNRIADPNLIFAGAKLRIEEVRITEDRNTSHVAKEIKPSSRKHAELEPKAAEVKVADHPAMNAIVAACDVTASIAHLRFPSNVELSLLRKVRNTDVALPLSKGKAKQYYEADEDGVRFGLLLTQDCKAVKMVRRGADPPDVEVVLNDRTDAKRVAQVQPEIAPGHVEENDTDSTADQSPLYAPERLAIRRFLREVVDPPYDTRRIEEMMLARYRLP